MSVVAHALGVALTKAQVRQLDEDFAAALSRPLDVAILTGRPEPEPPTLAGLLARRPELRGVGISAVLEARWTA